jgi:hypothetical protein
MNYPARKSCQQAECAPFADGFQTMIEGGFDYNTLKQMTKACLEACNNSYAEKGCYVVRLFAQEGAQ